MFIAFLRLNITSPIIKKQAEYFGLFFYDHSEIETIKTIRS